MKYNSLFITILIFVGYSSNPRWTEQANSTAIEEDETNQSLEWEYEPRIWTIDDDNVNDGDGDDDDDGTKKENFDSLLSQNANSIEDDALNRPIQSDDLANPHKLQHFIGSKQINNNQKQQNQVYVNTTCDQFRVDIREAVVCDKKRCDKLDFEWPKYDNQLTLIETTKHGMRFHRSDYAFAPRLKQQTNSHYATNILTPKSIDRVSITQRVKFDLLELFKPKPTAKPPGDGSSEPTTTTTTTTTDNSTQPETITTTQVPASADNQTDSSGLREQDANNTQLVSTFRLDTRRIKQKIVGFGGALSDSTCRNIKSLSPEMAKSLMEDYYGERGLRYNMIRISVGSSDFSTSAYTNNDKVSNKLATNQLNRQQQQQNTNDNNNNNQTHLSENDDLEMKNFRLTEEDYLIKLPVVRQAIATSKQELKIFASMWSPPIWMKNNSDIVHGYLKGDVYGPYYKALAELMLKWLEAYRKNGIEMWAFTGLNEPVTGVKPFIFHNSLGITRDDYITFMKLYLGPMMRQRGFGDVKLMIVDDNRGYMPNWAKTFLQDQEAAKYISGIASHWYMNDEYENLDFISKYHPDKFILSTEASNGYLPFQVHTLPGDWDRGVAYMYDITKMMQKNSVGWVDWNMVLDLSGGPSWIKNYLDAAIIVNARRDEYYKSPMFYAMGHFSRFVEKDSIRLDSRLANAKYDYPLEAVAFHTPNNYITIVALNANKHPIPFRIIVDRQLVRVITLRADSFNTIVFKWKKSHNNNNNNVTTINRHHHHHHLP